MCAMTSRPFVFAYDYDPLEFLDNFANSVVSCTKLVSFQQFAKTSYTVRTNSHFMQTWANLPGLATAT